MDGVRMVKVDNWAAFFLQKLQALYTRGDFTDLTLQFHTNECIKVHRLVLNTCTEYFETLIKENNASNHMRLPPTFQSDVVVPIINFMYSGRLEFRPELHQRLYNTAKILNMQILTKLLDTHVGAAATPKPQIQKLKHLTVPINAPCTVTSPTINSRISRSDHDGVDFVPGKKLPIWKKRTVPSSTFSLNVSAPKALPEEPAKPTRFEWPEDGDSDSTPILYSSTFDDISYDSVPIVKSINSIVQSALPPTPSQPLVQLPQQRVMPAATFESVFQSPNLKRNPSTRPQANQLDSCTPKKSKVEINEVKELVQAQEVRKSLLTDEPEQENEDLDDFLPVADNDADYEEDGEDALNEVGGDSNRSLSQPSTPANRQNNPKPILKVQAHDSPDSKEITPKKNVRFHLEPKVHAVASTSAPLDSQAASGDGISDSQIIAETPDENTASESESSEPISDSVLSKKQEPGGNTFEIRAPAKKLGDGSPVQSNHAKIIAEVLKKYPDLVKNNKNIRLKIIQKDGSPAVSVEKPGGQGDCKPKVSYMVVKADQSLRNKTQAEENTIPEGVLNRAGPWLCSTCNVERPIIFDTYFNYRKHLKEVHKAKVDVRICEHCGHRANKRNLLLYHLYKIHGVPPPPNCKFPKCDQCNHIALSEVLLAKHKNIHLNTKEFQCSMCHASFKSHSSLQSHLENSQRCNPRKKSFKCPVCTKVFPLQLNVKNHIRTDHPNLKLLEDIEELAPTRTLETHMSPLSDENIGQQHQTLPQVQVHHQQHSLEPTQQQQVQHQHTHPQQEDLNQHLQAQSSIQSEVHPQASMNAQPQTTYILPPGLTIVTDNNQALMPSTEAEALSNVASGIAASLGVADSMVVGDQGQPQTFIVVDKNSLIQIPGPGGAPGQVHEYIVPEIMTNDMSQSVGVYAPGHLSQLVQYTTAGGLQQPVAVSTSEQGLMTITTVNANGSIVNHTVPQQQGNSLMETAMMQIPQGHIQDHSGGEITMILTDHAYSEGIVRENGTVMQATSVPVSMNMVPTSAVVSVVSAVPTIPTTVPTSTMGDSGMVITPVCSSVQSIPTMVPSNSIAENASVITSMSISKVDPDENTTSLTLESDQQDSGPPPQKMAELASDWDDVEESEDHGGLQRSADDIAEDAALPSRPSILLKNELDAEDLPDNLPMKMT
ncbi:Centrosome-associated zinc finger protein CP190 [Frankliniella fusca]|uniref:Centrosome-associated zinc finger protein CP190 n=1 Tax=Frankliniella fusca TaxID=407009 RepID=A0AAE1LT55_9NEOP|nr:Centrosome-associated zinc finger protein CP190 [Frankliniella fusca]